MAIQTVHQSLSFATIIKDHPHRLSAEAHRTTILRTCGDWPQETTIHAAVDAARAGDPVLVRDNGEDETIRIRDTTNSP